MDKLQEYIDLLWDYIMAHGTQIIIAIVVYLVGSQVIKAITRNSKRLMEQREYDPTLTSWLQAMISIILKILLIISVLSMVGIEMTSFIAILGAAGLAIGLALQGTLANFAGGIMILVLKHFQVGDFIEGAGHSGTVKKIQIFNTVLHTPDNKVIIIPNGQLANNSVINYSKEETRRVDWTIGIAYGNDFDLAKKVLTELLEKDDRVLKDPPVFIALAALADSSVNITVRAWVKASDYWPLFWDMNERVYKEFDNHNLEFPFPQMDVHIQREA